MALCLVLSFKCDLQTSAGCCCVYLASTGHASRCVKSAGKLGSRVATEASGQGGSERGNRSLTLPNLTQ